MFSPPGSISMLLGLICNMDYVSARECSYYNIFYWKQRICKENQDINQDLISFMSIDAEIDGV